MVDITKHFHQLFCVQVARRGGNYLFKLNNYGGQVA